MDNRTKMGSVGIVILLSILLALSGMAAITSADIICPPNRFSGDVTLNGAPAPVGTVIEAYIDGEPRGSTTVELAGKYERLPVTGDYSDGGETITFTVDGLLADHETVTWVAMIDHVRILDLTAGADSDWKDEWWGPDSDGGVEVTTAELQAAIYHWLNDIPVRGHEMTTERLQEVIMAWLGLL